MVLAKYNNGTHELPIFDHDNAIGSFTWQYLAEVYVANNGHSGVTKAKLKQELDALMREIRSDVYDTFDLVADKMVSEIKGETYG